MENLEGMVGSIAVSLFLVGLKTDTTIALIVSPALPLPVERRLFLTLFSPHQAAEDIGRVAGGVFAVCALVDASRGEPLLIRSIRPAEP